MTVEHATISIIPWLALDQPIQVGPVTFWPSAQLDKRVPDEDVRQHLRSYLACYTTEKGEPLQSVTICENNSCQLAAPSASEMQARRRAVDALLFTAVGKTTASSLGQDNPSMGSPTSERFQLIHQNFRPGSSTMAVESGPNLHGGIPISGVSFPRPWCLGGHFPTFDDLVLPALGRLCESPEHDEQRERVFHALEWFRLAHTGSDDVSKLSKVVMMATAFEVLLRVPSGFRKSAAIGETLDRLCATDSHPRSTVQLGRESVELSPVGKWGVDFYRLRNAVVHGDRIPSNGLLYDADISSWVDHLIVADVVLWEVVIRELVACSLLTLPSSRTGELAAATFSNTDPTAIETALRESFVSLRFQFSRSHKQLGWLPRRPAAGATA